MKWKALLLLFVAAGAAVACAAVVECQTNGACCSAKPGPTNAIAPALPFTEKSIYQVESNWTTDAGKQIKLDTLKGRVRVVAMFFASCEFACPIIVSDMKRIEAGLPDGLRSQVGFVLVSFDSKRDTPEVLRRYRQQRNLPEDRWTLLRANSDDVLELAALLGVRYKQELRGQFAHSNMITVLNAEGEVVHQQIGLNHEIGETLKVIERLVPAGTDKDAPSNPGKGT